MDRVLEYLVGDGPQNRYALICRNCHSHNGMALKEEFEYISESLCCLSIFFTQLLHVDIIQGIVLSDKHLHMCKCLIISIRRDQHFSYLS